jgi:hypothetical protein
VPAGDVDPYALTGSPQGALSPQQRADLTRVVELARSICGYCFGVYLGPLGDGRASAVAQHATLPDPASAVLVAVDPSARLIEIVTGTLVAVNLDDRACELAVLAMKSCFQADDIVGGVREGVMLLAQHARHPRVLHLDNPA